MADASKARMQQIVAECILKSAHIILTARIYHSSRTLSMKGPKCWVRASWLEDFVLLFLHASWVVARALEGMLHRTRCTRHNI
jgi:hypothetical protein